MCRQWRVLNKLRCFFMVQNSDRQSCTVRNLVDEVTTMAVRYHHKWWPTGTPHSWREVSHAGNMDTDWPELCKFQTLSIGSVTLNPLKTFMFIVLYSLSAGWNQWKDSCQQNFWLLCWFLHGCIQYENGCILDSTDWLIVAYQHIHIQVLQC